ncbi:phosphatase PAP2 family protein [Devosia sp.]|uniref:phosphatase PAP2 family protein n=1 Tax=Devosia sp. TaxID=1871048 RepID=UPI003BAA1D65
MLDLTKPWPFGLNRRTAFPALAAVILLLFALWWVDAPLSRLAQALPAPVIRFFEWLTDFGESGWILYPSLTFWLVCTLLARVGNKWTARLALKQMAATFGFILLGVGLPGLVSNLLKSLIGRARPQLMDTVGTFAFQPIINSAKYESFPSGHSTTAMAFCLVVSFLSPRTFPVMLVFSVGIVLSRVIVGAHYPTDALSGAILGTLGAYWIRNLFAKRRWAFKRAADGHIRPRPLSAVTRLVRGRRQASR